jgi:hypothetical protein
VTIDQAGNVVFGPGLAGVQDIKGARAAGFAVVSSESETRRYRVAKEQETSAFVSVVLSKGWTRLGGLLIHAEPVNGFLDTLRITPAHSAAAGVPHQLEALGASSTGNPIVPLSLQWSLIDGVPGVRLSPDGVLLAADTGVYRVRASAGGWRASESDVSVGVPKQQTLALETWNGDALKHWRAFGEPQPVIDSGGAKRTLNVNGEGTFFSGVYSVDTFPVRDGLGIDVELSTPITMGQGQLIIFGFSPVIAGSGLAGWDHVTGWPQLPHSDQCAFHFPGGPDGATKADAIQLPTGRVAAPRNLRDGHWYRVRVNILPDGRCAVDLDGKLLSVSKVTPFRENPRVVYFYGSTAGTKVRVGRVEVYRGARVRPGI